MSVAVAAVPGPDRNPDGDADGAEPGAVPSGDVP